MVKAVDYAQLRWVFLCFNNEYKDVKTNFPSNAHAALVVQGTLEWHCRDCRFKFAKQYEGLGIQASGMSLSPEHT